MVMPLNINRAWSDSELLAVPPITIEPGHERNPFAADGSPIDRSKEPQRYETARRWSTLHWNPHVESLTDDMRDPFDELLGTVDSALTGAKDLFQPVFKDGALVGCHPIAASPHDVQAAEEWEQRCQAVHADQKIIRLPDKPGDSIRLVRGDADEIPKFEDSEESRKQRARIVRSD